MKPTVVITETLADVPAAWLGEHAHVVWCSHENTTALAGHLATAQGMIVRTYTQVDDALLDHAPALKVVGRAGVGLDNFDLPACEKRGIAVVHTPDANTQAVVEYVLGLMLDELRPRTNLVSPAEHASASASVNQGASSVHPPSVPSFHDLRKTEVGRQLDQLSLGIVGFGRIGKRLGKVAHALGMNLHVCDILPEAELRKAVDYPFAFMDHASLYARSDIVTIHVDGRADNRHMIDAAALSKLKPDAMLINAARGMLVDAAAVSRWGKAHPESRLILDVHDPEPPPPEYPLWGLSNVRLLPHLASRTHEALENMSWVVRDVVAVLEGREPRHRA